MKIIPPILSTIGIASLVMAIFAHPPRIIDGGQASASGYPFVVAIFACNNPPISTDDMNCNLHCTGTLVTPQSVLTAAHCFTSPDVPVSQLHVLIGATNYMRPEPGSQLIPVNRAESAGYGENVRFRLDDDVGIAHLEWGATLEHGRVETVILMTPESDDLRECEEIVVAGFGRSSNLPEGIRPSNGPLHIAHEQLHAFNVCEKSNVQDRIDMGEIILGDSRYTPFLDMQHEFILEERHVCFGGTSPSNLCNGDSGAPIMVHRAGGLIQVGIASYGIGDGEFCGPSVDYGTRVSNYAKWIWEKLVMAGTRVSDMQDAFESWPPISEGKVSQKTKDTRCLKAHEWQCQKVSMTCINVSQVCDGVADCPDGSDEPASCPPRLHEKRTLQDKEVVFGVSSQRPESTRLTGKDGEVIFAKPEVKNEEVVFKTPPSAGSDGGNKIPGKNEEVVFSKLEEVVFKGNGSNQKGAGGSSVIVENLPNPADSKVKFDDQPLPKKKIMTPVSDTVILEKHKNHTYTIRFARRRYGYKIIRIHDTKPSATAVAATVAPREAPKKRTRPSIIFSSDSDPWIREEDTFVERDNGTQIIDEPSGEIPDNAELDLGCTSANFEMITKRWMYLTGNSLAVNSEGAEDITDIHEACDRMFKACVNQNKPLLDGVVGPSAKVVREFCQGTERYRNWSERRKQYIESFPKKYRDTCMPRTHMSTDSTGLTGRPANLHATDPNNIVTGPVNWYLLGSQIVVIIGLLIFLFKRITSRT